MKATGQIVCTRVLKQGVPLRPASLTRPSEDWEVRCDWWGGSIAPVAADVLHGSDERYVSMVGKDVFQICHYRVRVVGMNIHTDVYFVMRDGLAARTVSGITAAVHRLSRRTVRFDAWLYKAVGRPMKTGDFLPRRTITAALLRLWNPPNWQV